MGGDNDDSKDGKQHDNSLEQQDGDDEEEEEEDLAKLQAEIARMEEEAERITKETEELEKKKAAATARVAEKEGSGGTAAAGAGATNGGGGADKPTRDGHSIYVGQVDYSATPEELLAHFEACGTVERVTIVCDKYTGRPKGFAYLEFQTDQAVDNAVKLDGSEFKGRALKVTHKRVNQPGLGASAPPAVAGRGGRGGGRFPPGGRGYRGGYRGGRGGRGRGGGRGGYHHPYY